MEFDIREDRNNAGVVCLAVLGELDLAAAPALEERLDRLRAERQSVRLDLSKLEFIDSTGIRLLIQAFNDAREDGWRLEIAPQLTAEVRRVFELVHMDRVIRGETSSDR